ncbi:MAG: PilZ domain-containing protein [Phycisphaeraceae bacterium]|nr:PilZ domain-containing protein [Phycisphaeraceae bacterium]MBX3406374.1 PilZ domain-containing protein [Phycisphaeraceae bacterium]
MSNVKPSDRRRGGRLVCEGLTCQFGHVADLSCTGAKVFSKKLPPMEVGDVAQVRFSGLGPEFVLPAQLVRLIKRPDCFECGFRFWSLNEVQSRTLGQMARVAADRRSIRMAV